MSRRLLLSAAAYLLLLDLPATDAASFTAGNLVVVQVGDGNNYFSDTDYMPVNLRELTTAGLLQQTIALPTVASGNQNILTLSRDRSAGQLNVSQDGNYLLLGGANTPPRELLISSQTIGRTIARVDWDGVVDTSTSLLGPFGRAGEVGVRSVASADGSQFWVAGKGGAADEKGVQYVNFGASASAAITDSTLESRHLSIVDGQLYNTQNGIERIGTGLPTSGPVDRTVVFPNLTGNGLLSSGLLFDLNPAVPGLDTAYFSYENQQTLPEIEKWAFDGTNWSQAEVFDVAFGSEPANPQGVLFLIGRQVGDNVELYATTRAPKSGSSRNSIVQVLDTEQGSTINLIATADEYYSFRGLAFVPNANTPPTLVGDFNRDDIVDGADFLLWQRELNAVTTPGTYAGADGDGDGIVAAADLQLWRQSFGNSESNVASATIVPEPASLALCGFAFWVVTSSKRRSAFNAA